MPALEEVVSKNVTTLIWAGDADFICNWMANHAHANNLKYEGHQRFSNKSLEPYNVDGKQKGAFKTEGNLSFLRVFDAGHTVMAFRKYAACQVSALIEVEPELSLQVFVQTMQKRAIYST
jgi:carboxypeptidase C (cathepsin A)